MRAAVATGSSIEVRDDVADPTPGPGQVLVHTIVCGICGSDLHALAAPEEMAQLNAAGGAASVPATAGVPCGETACTLTCCQADKTCTAAPTSCVGRHARPMCRSG